MLEYFEKMSVFILLHCDGAKGCYEAIVNRDKSNGCEINISPY